MFKSVLFKKENFEEAKIPDFFKDLNLDIIVNGVTYASSEYKLKPFFFHRLTNVEEIRYRQEVANDLEKQDVFETILNFSQKMRKMRLFLSRHDKLRHRYQKERWFLDAVLIYCEAVRELRDLLSQVELESEGLRNFYDYLDSYLGSEAFKTLRMEAEIVEEKLISIRYALFVKENKIRVQKYDSEIDYSEEVLKTFEKFKEDSSKDYRVDFNEMLDVNHVEAKILDFVGELYPDVFSELDAFCERNAVFQNEIISRFEREIQFYVSYLEYISPLKKSGLEFCYPEFLESKEIHVDGLFDLALAHKLCDEGKTVVRNDLELHGKERIVVITGPNQGGKTTFARAIGQVLYFAMLGLPVPARKAKFFVFDKMFTHFEKREDVANLQGKLEDDLVRIHEILERATARSVIIMNEIFSSTTLEDALMLGKKILEQISEIDAIAFLVTFIDELSSFNEHVVSMVSMVDENDPNVRTYKILRTPANGLSYALSLARKYGLTYEQLKKRVER